jgi:hypothetical protein
MIFMPYPRGPERDSEAPVSPEIQQVRIEMYLKDKRATWTLEEQESERAVAQLYERLRLSLELYEQADRIVATRGKVPPVDHEGFRPPSEMPHVTPPVEMDDGTSLTVELTMGTGGENVYVIWEQQETERMNLFSIPEPRDSQLFPSTEEGKPATNEELQVAHFFLNYIEDSLPLNSLAANPQS